MFFFVVDTNECGRADNGNCSQKCVNEIGSYHCECDIGYTLNPGKYACDGMSNKYYIYFIIIDSLCVDIDECSDNSHNCSHKCINTVGSYVCDCDIGYHLDDAELNCIGKQTL